jgi:predicted RNase H-like nuclease (RuvC/YqgF family)
MNATDAITVVRTQVEDLSAELEAGTRAVERMRTDAERVAALLRCQSDETTHMMALLHEIDELRARLRQQRATTRQLRHSVGVLRHKVSSLTNKTRRA